MDAGVILYKIRHNGQIALHMMLVAEILKTYVHKR
jgi:hypothetical protein